MTLSLMLDIETLATDPDALDDALHQTKNVLKAYEIMQRRGTK